MKKKYINTKLGIIDRYNESFWFSYFNAYLNLKKSRKDICNELGISMKVLDTIFKNIGYLDKYKDKIKKVSRVKFIKTMEGNKKLRDTCLKRYGVTTYTQTDEYLNKYKQTCLDKYGVESHNQDKTVKKKQVDALVANYGVDSPLRSKEILNKVKKTNMNKYGVENVFQIEEIKNRIRQDNLNSIEHINEKWLNNNYILLDEYLGLRDDDNNYIIYKFKCNKCNTEFKGYFCFGMIRCTGCFPRHKSIP